MLQYVMGIVRTKFLGGYKKKVAGKRRRPGTTIADAEEEEGDDGPPHQGHVGAALVARQAALEGAGQGMATHITLLQMKELPSKAAAKAVWQGLPAGPARGPGFAARHNIRRDFADLDGGHFCGHSAHTCLADIEYAGWPLGKEKNLPAILRFHSARLCECRKLGVEPSEMQGARLLGGGLGGDAAADRLDELSSLVRVLQFKDGDAMDGFQLTVAYPPNTLATLAGDTAGVPFGATARKAIDAKKRNETSCRRQTAASASASASTSADAADASARAATSSAARPSAAARSSAAAITRPTAAAASSAAEGGGSSSSSSSAAHTSVADAADAPPPAKRARREQGQREVALEEGMRVKGRYLASSRGAAYKVWYAGVVTDVHDNGTYDISYDEGDDEMYVQRRYILLEDESAGDGSSSSSSEGDAAVDSDGELVVSDDPSDASDTSDDDDVVRGSDCCAACGNSDSSRANPIWVCGAACAHSKRCPLGWHKHCLPAPHRLDADSHPCPHCAAEKECNGLPVGRVVWASGPASGKAWPASIVDPRCGAAAAKFQADDAGRVAVCYFGLKRTYEYVDPRKLWGFGTRLNWMELRRDRFSHAEKRDYPLACEQACAQAGLVFPRALRPGRRSACRFTFQPASERD